jgi:hypothetical protein
MVVILTRRQQAQARHGSVLVLAHAKRTMTAALIEGKRQPAPSLVIPLILRAAQGAPPTTSFRPMTGTLRGHR